MDDMKLSRAIALLQAIKDELPDGDIEEKIVDLYHSTLTDIQNETGLEFTEFFIPASELHQVRELTGARGRFGEFKTALSRVRYCDRARFLIGLRGAINFITSLSKTHNPRRNES